MKSSSPSVPAPASSVTLPRRPSRTRTPVPPVVRRRSRYLRSLSTVFALYAAAATIPAKASPADDERAVAALDTAFQAAVKANDAATIERILTPDMVLVTGRGAVFTAAQHVEQAKARTRTYEQQDEVAGTQKVRVQGDTAIVTALLWIKGRSQEGKAFDYRVWFSDTYVRTAAGWKYFFGQASLPLPSEDAKPTGN